MAPSSQDWEPPTKPGRFKKEIEERTFVVPIDGVKLIDVDALQLGSFKVVPASSSFFAADLMVGNEARVHRAMENTKAEYWLVGSAKGTSRVAELKFREQSELIVGLLAICVASMFENGASRFRIKVVMGSEAAYGPAQWFSWGSEKRVLTTHSGFGYRQPFEIRQELVKQFDDGGLVDAACRIFESQKRNPLEDAIAKAVYWYAEAHREVLPVMKLLKYWSAVETFFSEKDKNTTNALKVGMAAVLVFGGFDFIPHDQYSATKNRVSELYDSRSIAVHRASYDHVSEQDAAEMSRLVSWMLLNMIAFQMDGYTEPGQIKRHAQSLDERMCPKEKAVAPSFDPHVG